MTVAAATPPPTADGDLAQLAIRLEHMGIQDAADQLRKQPVERQAALLTRVNVSLAERLLERMNDVQRQGIFALAPVRVADQWRTNLTYANGTVGRLMEPPIATFLPSTTVRDTIDRLRELVKQAFITYAYVVDEQGKLQGVIVMRELLFANPDATLADIALRNPFYLAPQMDQMDAMRAVLDKHYPVYPVCDGDGKLVGLIRGSMMFERQAIELTAQAGAMVGVEKEERLTTPWPRSLKFRHPWLQLNLLTAFVAAAVVGFFEPIIGKVVVLAVFLPVLAGQSGNTGCQSLAVTLRGMTLGELEAGGERKVVIKEAILGLCNGALVGLTAGLGMYVYALLQHRDDALTLAFVVLIAMTGACVISGIAGVIVPSTLRRLGADPATASSIFLTTATDVASMGMFLGLATIML